MGHPRNAPAHPGAAETNPVFAGLGLAALVAAGALLVGAISSGWGLLGWLAGVAAAASGLFFALSGAGGNPARRVRLDGGAVTVELRRTFPLTAAVFAGTLGAFLATSAATEDDPAVRLAATLAGLLCLIPLPDLVRAALTDTHVTFGATHVTVRSWTTRASVDWADVAAVDTDITIPARPAVRILTRPNPPSLQMRRRRLLVPLEPRAPDGQIVLAAFAFDEPWLLAGYLATLVDLTPADRTRRLEHGSVQLLTGQSPLHA